MYVLLWLLVSVRTPIITVLSCIILSKRLNKTDFTWGVMYTIVVRPPIQVEKKINKQLGRQL